MLSMHIPSLATGSAAMSGGEIMSTPGQARAESLLSAEKRTLEMIANRASLPDVLDDLCRAIDAHAPGVISTVLLMDPDGKRLWLEAGPRFPAVLKPAISPWPIGDNRGSCGTAAFLKQRVFISDVTTDPRFPDDYRSLAVSYGLRASWSEPLISKDGAVLGTFAMYYAEPRIPDKSDLELIEAAGHIALIAIQLERSQAALQESEERFRLAAEAGKMFAYEWDVATDLIVRSGESVQILGIGESQPITAQELMALVHRADRERVTAAIAALSPEKSYLQISYRRVRPDGTVIWVERIGRAHFDEQGKMVRMIGMVADITERKLAERELALANDRLRLAMEAGKAVGWDRNVKSGRDSLFGDLQSMFGISSEIYDGRVDDFHRYLHPEDRRRVVEAIDYAMGMHKPYAAEFRLRWPDGTVRWLAAKGRFYYSREGDPERMLGMAIDITDHKLTEEALRESEERFRLAIQAGRMYAFDWNVITDEIVRSEESTHIFGLTGEPIKLTKRELLARVHPEDRATFTNSIVECTPESPNTQIRYRLLRPDGSVLWLERTGHAFFDEQGKMVRMIGMVADITERKLAEEALTKIGGRLIEAHEEERTRIALELHDDVGQRLALLAVHLDGLKQSRPTSATEFGSQIEELHKQVEGLASDVQALSHRLHSPKLELLGLAAVAGSFCREFSDGQGVEIDYHSENIPKELPQEVSLCLFRVLQEALQNATKHSGSRSFQVSFRGAASEIELTVRDSGIGFETDEAMKGPGLGLTSMQERLKLVDGKLSIDSKPQRGTTIQARVPLNPRMKSARAVG
jgi:PAS domain S-box-containing protein